MATGDGRRVGQYVLQRELASGAMGVVYVAQHRVTQARAALKLLRPEAATQETVERFLREVRAAARIGHEGIVQVYDAGRTEEGELFLAMELLQGQTFEERIEAGADRLHCMQLLGQLLDPLAAAHAEGIIHRDLKPANVFVARRRDGTEQVKLLDFGIAREAGGKSVTATGIAIGTPYYMSPEQATRPSATGPTADIWSVGVMMYEVLSGEMPFDGETLHAVLLSASVQPHIPVESLSPSLDPDLAALVNKCLEKEPDGRPQNAAELQAALEPILARPKVQQDLQRAATRPPGDLPQAIGGGPTHADGPRSAARSSGGAGLGAAASSAQAFEETLAADSTDSAPSPSAASMHTAAGADSTALASDDLPSARPGRARWGWGLALVGIALLGAAWLLVARDGPTADVEGDKGLPPATAPVEVVEPLAPAPAHAAPSPPAPAPEPAADSVKAPDSISTGQQEPAVQRKVAPEGDSAERRRRRRAARKQRQRRAETAEIAQDAPQDSESEVAPAPSLLPPPPDPDPVPVPPVQRAVPTQVEATAAPKPKPKVQPTKAPAAAPPEPRPKKKQKAKPGASDFVTF